MNAVSTGGILVSSPAWVHELIEHLIHAETARLLAR